MTKRKLDDLDRSVEDFYAALGAKAGGGSGPRASQMAALPAAAVQHSPGRVLSLDGQRT